MKPTLYFHIGLPKTGTSALQAFFALNVKLLLKKGILYPYPQPLCLPYQASSGNGIPFYSQHQNFDRNKRDQIISAAVQHSIPNILISYESLYRHTATDWKELISDAYHIKAILYLRNQVDLISSFILQRIKNHKRTKLYQKEDGSLFYSKYLSHIAEGIGKEKILLRIYEKEQLAGGNIYTDFLSLFGLELTDEYEMPDPVTNPSLTRDYAEIKRLCNTLPFDKKTINQTFLNPLWDLSVAETGGLPFSSQNILSPQERIHIYEQHAEDNVRVAKEYLGREDGRLFYTPPPTLDDPWEPYPGLSTEKVVKAFAHISIKQQQKINRLETELKKRTKEIKRLKKIE